MRILATIFITLLLPNPATAQGGFDILAYVVRIAPNIAQKTLTGTTTIHFKPVRDVGFELAFPLNGLVIEAVRLNGMSVPFRANTGQLLVAVPAATKNPGELAVDYRGKPTQGLKIGTGYLYTAFSTCHWMICREECGDKAAFTLDLIVPANYRVIASGSEQSTEKMADGQMRHLWEEKRPYSPYLFGFAAGEFAETTKTTSTTTLRFLGVNQTAEELKNKFQDTARMLAFFEGKAGVQLPQKIYTQVLIPGSEAQEASTFSIIGRDQLDPILADPQEDWVIAHELAHQWWGNLVTCKDWSHFWLNEGLTVFMVAAYKEERWGRATYEREMQLAGKRHQNAVLAKFDVPLAFAGNYPSLQIKRAITYSKGALFLDALRTRLGDAAFWKGIKAYTQQYLGKTVESRDFQRALETASGEELSMLFKQWVYE